MCFSESTGPRSTTNITTTFLADNCLLSYSKSACGFPPLNLKYALLPLSYFHSTLYSGLLLQNSNEMLVTLGSTAGASSLKFQGLKLLSQGFPSFLSVKPL